VDKDSIKKAANGLHRGADPSAAEASLSDALNGLEQILENRQGVPSEAQNPDGSPPDPASDDSQLTIPLLHDVVAPGDDGPVGRQSHGAAQEPDLEDDEACRKLAQRLANEIEVIVRARVEAAVHEAAEEIRGQVRNHLEIMLPEIIEEFRALGRRQRG
jgi:hypothetical protein